MITADNITDGQIRELRESILAEADRAHEAGVTVNASELLQWCDVAIEGEGMPKMTEAARARCAEILNARAKEAK